MVYAKSSVSQSQEFLLMHVKEVTANPKSAQHYLFAHGLVLEVTLNQKKNHELVT